MHGCPKRLINGSTDWIFAWKNWASSDVLKSVLEGWQPREVDNHKPLSACIQWLCVRTSAQSRQCGGWVWRQRNYWHPVTFRLFRICLRTVWACKWGVEIWLGEMFPHILHNSLGCNRSRSNLVVLWLIWVLVLYFILLNILSLGHLFWNNKIISCLIVCKLDIYLDNSVEGWSKSKRILVNSKAETGMTFLKKIVKSFCKYV